MLVACGRNGSLDPVSILESRMKYLLMGVFAVSLLATGGCAKYWYQEGKSFTETSQDLAACQGEAARYADTERTLGLGGFERKFVAECMDKKGYRLVPESELPMRIKRETTPVFGIPGIAGTID
jgi:hypothetical protein